MSADLFAKQVLSKPCPCGYDGREDVFSGVTTACTQVGLFNHVYFPPFGDLPNEHDADDRYYDFSSGMGIPRKHWCLMGDIVEDVSCFVRRRAKVKTRFDEEIIVHFYLKGSDKPKFFSWDCVQPGESTMCIFYPVVRNFMDMSQGIRQESPSTVMVFPVTLDVLREELGIITTSLDTNKKNVCAICGKADAKVSTCSKCKVVHYCGRACQQSHWKQGHKQLCGKDHIPTLVKLALFDMDKFRDFQDWTFEREPMSETEKRRRVNASMTEYIGKMCPGTTLLPLRRLLDAIGGRVLLGDRVEMVFERIRDDIRKMVLPSGKETRVNELFIFAQLMEFCQVQADDSSQRVHVVDQKENRDGSLGLGGFGTELTTTSFMLAVPLWLHELDLSREIIFVVEDHSFYQYIKDSAFDETDWTVVKHSDAVDSAMLNHKRHGTVCFLADSMATVGDLAVHIAQKNSSRTCVRLLRAIGNPSYSSTIRRLAKQETPTNLFTLWIREDTRMTGSYGEPFDKNRDLAEELLAVQHDDPLMSMLSGMGLSVKTASTTAVATSNSRGRVEGKQGATRRNICCICGGSEHDLQFSKNQRSKPHGSRKCSTCAKAQ